MANIKSQIKRIGTNEKARLRNKAAKAEVKTRVKTALYTAETGHEDAADYLRVAVKRLDKAAARGIIHPNQASNRKSALMRHFARSNAEFGGSSAGGLAVEDSGPEEASEPVAQQPAASPRRRPRPTK